MPNMNDHEYSIFSQNGEDGIVAFLTSGLRDNRRRFIEIGTSDGSENNSFYLLKKGWTGLGIDMNEDNIRRYMGRINNGLVGQRLTLAHMKVGWGNCRWILEEYGDKTPDFFSLDIDGVDYYVAYRLFQLGFRPSLVCCEYNAFMGMAPLTVTYRANFMRKRFDPARGLYFGASVGAWQHLLCRYGYKYFGVDSAGVNVFFGLPDAFKPGFLDEVTGLQYAYAQVFMSKFSLPGEELERELLSRDGLVFVDVTKGRVEDIVASSDLPVEDGPRVYRVSTAVDAGPK